MVEDIKRLIDLFVELQNPDVRDSNGERLSPRQHALWVYQKRKETAEVAKRVAEQFFTKFGVK